MSVSYEHMHTRRVRPRIYSTPAPKFILPTVVLCTHLPTAWLELDCGPIVRPGLCSTYGPGVKWVG